MSWSPKILAALTAFALIAPAALRAQQQPAGATIDMIPVAPESVGFSAERLERLHTFIQSEIDRKQLAGAITLLARHGKVIDYRTYGMRDLAAGTPMSLDTIFRDYSMTKPVTGVAMMMLYEQGKWLPTDPIEKYIPEFAHLKVFNGFDATGKMLLADPAHPPTMGE
ncbi:MAG: serine hydrolase domain-containing protein, partial [Terracidiphilus sp.]